MSLLGVLALAGSIFLTACGEGDVVATRASTVATPPTPSTVATPPTPSNIATLQDLIGPWQATPFALDPAWRETIETACRHDLQQPQAEGGVVDARGGGVATVRFVRPVVWKCDALRVTPEGKVVGAGAGGGGYEDEPPPERPVHIGYIEERLIRGGELTSKGWSLTGPVSAEVTRVEVVTESLPPITASLEHGWFSAWWPAQPGDPPLVEGAMAPYLVLAFDADGRVLEEQEGSSR